jgi:hypothetical protein
LPIPRVIVEPDAEDKVLELIDIKGVSGEVDEDASQYR